MSKVQTTVLRKPDEISEFIKDILDREEIHNEHMDKLKDIFQKDIIKIANAITYSTFNFEKYAISQGFKRIKFSKTEETFSVGKTDFYGNITVNVQHPKAICYLSLNFIWELSSLGFDRYDTILSLQSMIKRSHNEFELVEMIVDSYINVINRV
jgi:hypothetical protein